MVYEHVLDVQQPLCLRDPDGEGGDRLGDRVDVLRSILDEAVGDLRVALAVQVQGPDPELLLEDPLAQRQQEVRVGGRGGDDGGVAHPLDATVDAPWATGP